MKRRCGFWFSWLLVLVLASCAHVAEVSREMSTKLGVLGQAQATRTDAETGSSLAIEPDPSPTALALSTPLPLATDRIPSTPLPRVATLIPSTPLPRRETQVSGTPMTPASEERDDARGVVEAFLEAASAGDVEAAMSYWYLEAPDQPAGYAAGMRRLVAEWATGQHQLTVGEATYGGMVGPQDYRELDESDPRVQQALVTVTIDGRESAFHLDKIDTAWLISGYMTPGTPLAPVQGPAPEPVYIMDRDVFRMAASGEQRIGALPEDAGHLAWGPLGLAYVSDRQIQVLHPDEGTTHTWVTFPGRASQDFDLRWSGDGLALAYAVAWDEPDGSRQVELGVCNGTQQTIIDTRVTRAAGPTPTPPPMPPVPPMPGFAILDIVGFDRPDGHVAVTQAGGQERYSAVWFYDLTTTQLDGETLVNVEIHEMALAPDQTRLAVVRPGRVQVWLLGTDAPPMEAELPESTHAAGLHWSADGQRLAYLVNEGHAPGPDAALTQGLWVWQEGHGRQVRPVAQQAMLHGWVPSGREVVLEVLDPAGAQMVVRLVDVETGESRPAAVPAMARFLGWSAD